MSRDEKGYNGWANYATWRVYLEMFDRYDPDGEWMTGEAVEEMADEWLTTDFAEWLTVDITKRSARDEFGCLALDYARVFLRQVNWDEIAAAINETWETPDPDATDEEGGA
jgi:hypothetical protein